MPLRYDVVFYNKPIGTYASKAAFKHAHHCGRHVKGHQPTCVKSVQGRVLYRCNLHSSGAPCLWAGMLVRVGEEAWEFRVADGDVSGTHNEKSELKDYKACYA